ncbi:hypothetical protein [Sporosarcina obsidiansis]|uniref:hypothetical protein n=1 Tax=Sporosarcina obsidiansis TaxID=2660748 RepID=UPI00129BFB40|nr:hypothetical protein [Sporosarcina obsidiansis]
MLNVHYSPMSRQVFIDEGSRTTTIDLPAGLDASELAYVLPSDTLRAIIQQLTNEKGTKR